MPSSHRAALLALLLAGAPASADGAPDSPRTLGVAIHAAATWAGIAPDLLAAVVWVESRGHPWAVAIGGTPRYPGSHAEAVALLQAVRGRADIGLAQIHYEGRCSSEANCEAKRQALLNPVVNIQTMGRHIDRVRQWCREQTGRPALFARWLHAYGYNQTKDVRCNQRRTTTGWRDLPVPTELSRIIKYRQRLLKLLTQRRNAHKRRRRSAPG